MRKLLTSDQFVAGIVAALALRKRTRFRLSDTEIDQRFEAAYEDLVASEDELGVFPNFSFYIDPFHKDSVCLRETLTSAKEKKLIALPTLETFDVKLEECKAYTYFDRIPLPREFFIELVDRHFAEDFRD